jgi:hypothetical protein
MSSTGDDCPWRVTSGTECRPKLSTSSGWTPQRNRLSACSDRIVDSNASSQPV